MQDMTILERANTFERKCSVGMFVVIENTPRHNGDSDSRMRQIQQYVTQASLINPKRIMRSIEGLCAREAGSFGKAMYRYKDPSVMGLTNCSIVALLGSFGMGRNTVTASTAVTECVEIHST